MIYEILDNFYFFTQNLSILKSVPDSHTVKFRLKSDIEKIYADKCTKNGTVLPWKNSLGEPKPCPYLNMVWLNCDGQDDPDKENIGEVRILIPAVSILKF